MKLLIMQFPQLLTNLPNLHHNTWSADNETRHHAVFSTPH